MQEVRWSCFVQGGGFGYEKDGTSDSDSGESGYKENL